MHRRSNVRRRRVSETKRARSAEGGHSGCLRYTPIVADPSPAAGGFDSEAIIARVEEAKKRIAPLLPDIDPGDLDLILASLFRPFGSGRRFLLRQIRPGVYVF